MNTIKSQHAPTWGSDERRRAFAYLNRLDSQVRLNEGPCNEEALDGMGDAEILRLSCLEESILVAESELPMGRYPSATERRLERKATALIKSDIPVTDVLDQWDAEPVEAVPDGTSLFDSFATEPKPKLSGNYDHAMTDSGALAQWSEEYDMDFTEKDFH